MFKQISNSSGAFVSLLILCLVLVNFARAESSLPESFTVTYKLHVGPLTLGETTRKLYKNGDGNFVYESYSKPIGYARWFTDSTLLERSEWIFHGEQLRPLNYSYDRTSSKRERHVKLRFDWDKMRVTNEINSDPWTMDIPDGTLDKLLYHLAVMIDLQQGKSNLVYHVADGGTLKTYEFQNLGEETIDTKLGQLKTIKLMLPGKRDTILWCAKALDFLPVRIVQEEDGKELNLKLESFTGFTLQKNP